MNFEDLYRDVFASLGYPLSRRTGIADSTVDRAERRLGIVVPEAIRVFYGLAGRERRLSQCHNRFSRREIGRSTNTG